MKPMDQQKAQLRSHLRALRKQIDRRDLERDSALVREKLLMLPEMQRAQTVFCYASCGGEVDTHPLIAELLRRGKVVAVPRCKGKGVMECVPVLSLSQLQPGPMGILEPPSHMEAIPPEQVDFVVVPAVACGEDGSRLGQGGGYYDRFLEKVHCAFAAVCFEAFLFSALPCEKHDQFMKIIVTQQRVLRFEDV